MSTFETVIVAGIVWMSFVLWIIGKHLEKIEEVVKDIKNDVERIRNAREP